MNLTLHRQDVVLERPVRASAQDHSRRSRLFLRLEHDGVAGYGEVAPQPFELNNDPGFDDVLDETRVALERLADVVTRERSVPSWSRVARMGSSTPASNAAAALIEMAVLDRELRVASRGVDEVWPPRFETPRQATFSLLDDDTEWRVNDDVARVRVKIAPGPLRERAIDRLAQLLVPVLVDYNCSASDDEEVLRQVAQIRDVATISAVEQPYAVGNLADHARLARKIDVPLSLDEGVRSLRDLKQIVAYGAGQMICVKPARVGGLANARAMFARADELGLNAYLGGFFESPFARRVHSALATSCVREPSDLGDVALSESTGTEVDVVPTSFGVVPSSAMLEHARRLSVEPENES
ncbi:MAG TPA: enolase C-terminal domain-like protein [Acidimicrobiales bacterium]|jgi:O-succinylbenzoate synthase|nr:enolase C-terminal domain-like protein [Acidimicrobiales bacterium]